MRTLEELYEERSRVMNEINKIEGAERAEKNRSLIGKVFKMRNSYGCPEKDSDYWWKYFRVIGVSDSGNLNVLTFETVKGGNCEIGTAIYYNHSLDHYTEITIMEYDQAKDKFLKAVSQWAEVTA